MDSSVCKQSTRQSVKFHGGGLKLCVTNPFLLSLTLHRPYLTNTGYASGSVEYFHTKSKDLFNSSDPKYFQRQD